MRLTLCVCLLLAAAFSSVDGRALGRQKAKILSAEGVRESFLPVKTANGYTLYGGLTVTNAQLDQLRPYLMAPANILSDDYVFWHWTTWQTCVRRATKGVNQGEMEYLINNDSQMRVGGGLYIARNPKTSSNYGPCPLQVTIKKGTPQYVPSMLANAAKINIANNRQKAGLGTVLDYVHYYDADYGWWVTHSANNIKDISLGFKDWPSIPWWSEAAKTPYTIRPAPMSFIQLYDLIQGPNGMKDTIAKEMGMTDGTPGGDSLNWLKSFYFLMQYIDGPSLVRAVRNFGNPWDAFEPQNFGGYMKAWTSFLDARLAKPDGSAINADGYHYGIAVKGTLGEGGNADAWATRQRDEAILKLCKLCSGGRGDCTYRWDVVRAGGDEPGKTFKATPGQVAAMQKNPYLVVNAAKQDDGNFLAYYYYPDPTHLNPALKSRVSPALWTTMTTANYSTNPELIKTHGAQLISELMLDMFKRHFGKPVGLSGSQNGLSLILDMVSIHPFTDFNGRTTRFYLVAAQIESAYADNNRKWTYGDTPAAFISDFDLVTPFSSYQTQVQQGTQAINNLRIEMFAEWIRGLKSGSAKHFELPAWGRFADDALGWARGSKHVEFDSSDWPLIEKRRFVDLLDKKLGNSWPTRN